MVRKKSTKGSAVKSAKAKKSAAAKRAPSRSVKPSSGTTGAKSSGAKQESMPLKVRQGCDYRGQDWWGWSVWIEAGDSVLDEIEYVEYSLHPTFPDPVRRVTNREEKFLIKSEGWGEFMIGVHIFTRKGEHLKRQHWLTLDYPTTPSKKNIASGGARLSKRGSERPTLFLSGGVTELGLANALSEALEQEGFEVVRMEDAPPGVPWDQAIRLLTKQADIMVMLISGGLTSWGMREIAAAIDHKLPILPVVVGPLSQLPEELRGFQAIPLKDASDPTAIAPQLAQQIKQSIKH